MSVQRGPSIDELVAKETVDILTYIGWEEEKMEQEKRVQVGNKIYISV